MTVRSVSTLRVRYAETDQMGIAWHGNYLAWFEVGRTDLLRGLGETYKNLEAQGYRLPVVAAEARFLKPAHYDDVLDVHTDLEDMAGARLVFRYEVLRAEDHDVVARGRTHHAVVNSAGRPTRIPARLKGLLRPSGDNAPGSMP